jgi:FecR-like protein
MNHIKYLLFMFLLIPFTLFGNRLLYLDGDVSVTRANNTFSGDIGMNLKEGDLIETGSDSMAIIELENRGDLKLRENTQIILSSLKIDTSVKVERGGLFSKIKKIFSGSYTVTTSSTAAGVRGTEFFVAFGKLIDEEPDVWLCVNEGSVMVEIKNTNQSVLVEEGKGITIPGGMKLTKPIFYPWTKNLNWNTDPDKGILKDKTDLDSAYDDLLDQDYD